MVIEGRDDSDASHGLSVESTGMASAHQQPVAWFGVTVAVSRFVERQKGKSVGRPVIGIAMSVAERALCDIEGLRRPPLILFT